MERLTAQWGENHAVPTKIDLDFVFDLDDKAYGGLTEILDRLAAYEDIGTVEDFQRLVPKMVSCPKGWQGTRDTRYICPCCKKAVRNDERYCHKCGQALSFPKQVYDKENNKIWLDFSEETKEDTANDKCRSNI